MGDGAPIIPIDEYLGRLSADAEVLAPRAGDLIGLLDPEPGTPLVIFRPLIGPFGTHEHVRVPVRHSDLAGVTVLSPNDPTTGRQLLRLAPSEHASESLLSAVRDAVRIAAGCLSGQVSVVHDVGVAVGAGSRALGGHLRNGLVLIGQLDQTCYDELYELLTQQCDLFPDPEQCRTIAAEVAFEACLRPLRFKLPDDW